MEAKFKYEEEANKWIEEGIKSWKENVENGVLLLMAVVQTTKSLASIGTSEEETTDGYFNNCWKI